MPVKCVVIQSVFEKVTKTEALAVDQGLKWRPSEAGAFENIP